MPPSSQPAENFDSTAKLMLEALAKASAELEKSVTHFTEQLISFNESVQKSLEDELRNVTQRLDATLKANLDQLGHDKDAFLKRLADAERSEVELILSTGHQVRASLRAASMQAEQRMETFIDNEMALLKTFLAGPEEELRSAAETAVSGLDAFLNKSNDTVRSSEESTRKALSDKVQVLEKALQEEMTIARTAIESLLEHNQTKLRTKAESVKEDIEKLSQESTRGLARRADDGVTSIGRAEDRGKQALDAVCLRWREQVRELCDVFDSSLSNLTAVLREAYDVKLSNVADQAKTEIKELSAQAHEKIAATRSELEVILRDLEKEYLDKFEALLKRLESIVSEHSNDKYNNGIARQHKAQKLREQMQSHLRRWGSGLVDSVKHAAGDLENDFLRSTDGFHQRIEGARSASIELLERESRLMAKDIERTVKEFQKEIVELESQLSQIEKAGQDAALTVIAYRKAMLSFGGE